MSGIDINRKTNNVILDPEVSSEIWAKTLEESAIMQLARRINMPGSGVKVQTIVGEPEAQWVDETAAKPVGTHTFGQKPITPYKLAIIEPFSDEFRRDKSALYNECINRLPRALAKKFDQTVMGTTAPGSGFDTLGGAQKISILTNQYAQFVAVDALISEADGIMNGIALAPQGKSLVLGAVDGQQRPLFTAGVEANTVGNILGAPVQVRKGVYVAGAAGSPGTPAIVGVAGDFTDAVYGTVEGIRMNISDQATLTVGSGASATTINLWQQNMFAVRFEIEVAFAVKDINEFVLLTGATPTA